MSAHAQPDSGRDHNLGRWLPAPFSAQGDIGFIAVWIGSDTPAVLRAIKARRDPDPVVAPSKSSSR